MSIEVGAPRIIYREEFEAAGRKQGKLSAVITRAWNATEYASICNLDFSREQMREYHDMRPINLNFNHVMEMVRETEQGQRSYLLLGKTSWDIVASLNNEGLRVSDAEYMIPWIEPIHHDFRNGEERRLRASERLQEAYRALSSVAVQSYTEIVI